jgi:hypothetical protein
MNRLRKFKLLLAVPVCSLILHANSALACAACFGKSDSPLAKGMNWGIFSLLGVVVCVLGGVASVAIFLAKKSAGFPVINPPGEALPSTQKA